MYPFPCPYFQPNYMHEMFYPIQGLRFAVENIFDDENIEDQVNRCQCSNCNINDISEVGNEKNQENEYDDRTTNDANMIFNMIEKKNPMLLRRLVMCGIPYAEAKNIIQHIIHLSLLYSNKPPR